MFHHKGYLRRTIIISVGVAMLGGIIATRLLAGENATPNSGEATIISAEIHSVEAWQIDSNVLPPSKVGIHLMLDDGRQAWPLSLWRDHMRAARDIVGEWGLVTQVIRSDDLDPTRWQVFMDLCAELHLVPIIRLATTYDFEHSQWTAPSKDADGRYTRIASEYTDFINTLEWPFEIHYILVGNEPNHGDEWGGTPNPAEYARFLMDVALAIHAVDPNSVIMNGGFDPFAPNTGTIPFSDGTRFIDSKSFMDGMFAAEPTVFEHLDAWASHAYPLGAFIQPPWEQAFQIDYVHDSNPSERERPPDGIVNRGVNGYVWELYQLEAYGVDPLPVFITETGWRHAETVDTNSNETPSNYPSPATVATYIDLALYGNNGRYPDLPEDGWIAWLNDPRVVGITFFALNGSPNEWSHTNWLQMSADGEVLGTYPMAGVLSYQGE